MRNNCKLKICNPTLEKPGGSLTNSVEDYAEVLADAFSAVHVNGPMGPLPEFGSHVDIMDRSIHSIPINLYNVKEELLKLN